MIILFFISVFLELFNSLTLDKSHHKYALIGVGAWPSFPTPTLRTVAVKGVSDIGTCDCACRSELNLGVQPAGFTVVKSYRPTDDYKDYLRVRLASTRLYLRNNLYRNVFEH